MDGGAAPVGLQFSVLGPVEVRRDGTPVALGGVRQRALLAMVVLHHGEVVSADRLIDAIFVDDAGDGGCADS
jgi:DNA-binding SARP family transcriptional activator